MSQVVQTNGNYTIKTVRAGVIRLDTGPGIGETRITGNLVVDGVTVTVDAENIDIKDNVITLNYGETADGVSLQYSGIEIDRGFNGGTANPRASLVFNEATDTFEIGKKTSPGVYDFFNSAIKTRYIRTDGNTDRGDLSLINTGIGVVKVSGTTDYLNEMLLRTAENAAAADDILANKAYVDYAVLNNPTYFVEDDDTRVVAADTTIHGSGGPSRVLIQIDNNTRATIYDDRMTLFNLDISDRKIAARNTNDSVSIEANGTGKVIINAPLQMENQGFVPAAVALNTIVYAGTPGTGDSGVYFVNTTESAELTNKNRALLWSILF